ncbi:ATP-dependent RNA helicase Mss116p, mitochondrial [[Candida] jaroonii]|uniref:ATP-dependent RNA helicase Mss116p, mitochondrial n=1 Tax=[Candida] jaroonii TaxID=467808 RepID=A0ACA9Y706_9ASCO|nr:ATP-dependent RNA helicase Mss116p, mitochondrial [[Candida] jaroonii]
MSIRLFKLNTFGLKNGGFPCRNGNSLNLGGFKGWRCFSGSSRCLEEEEIHSSITKLKDSEKLDPMIFQALDTLNFKALTKVQAESIIPSVESDKGLVVRAKTGTGKTLAFLLPILNELIPSRSHSIKNKRKIFHLIISPTRDLAMQIESELVRFVKAHPTLKKDFVPRISLLTGSKRSDLESLFAPSIVIATPGRLMATIQNKRMADRFRGVKTITYDEADRLLDNGFRDDILNIIDALKEKHVDKESDSPFKHLLYSATVDGEVAKFAKEFIGKDYKYIDCVEEAKTEAHENINQIIYKTKNLKQSMFGSMDVALNKLKQGNAKIIIFLPTVLSTQWYYEVLSDSRRFHKLDGSVHLLHGKLTQSARDRAIREFRRAKSGIFIATDVAARGLDFPDISSVIQVNPSNELANYIHKIGRTGRAGRKGEAILFQAEFEHKYIKALQREKQIKFNETVEYELPEDTLVELKSRHDGGEAVKSLCAYYSMLEGTYRISLEDALFDLLEVYQTFHPDEKIPPVSSVLGRSKISRNVRQNVFDIDEDHDSNKRHERFDRFSRNGGKGRDDRSFRNDRYGRDKSFGGRNYGDRNYGDKKFGGRDGKRSYDRNSGDRYDRNSGDRYGRNSGDRYGRNSSQSYGRNERYGRNSGDRSNSRSFEDN